MNKNDINALIHTVEAYCAENGIRFTAPRRLALEIIAANSGKPLGAYDVLEALGKKLDNPKPPTAYRAIEFLQKHGFVHRIESLNAYVACRSDHRHEGSQFMICEKCGKVTEAHLCSLPASLADRVRGEDFHLSRWNAELYGLCRDCRT